MIRRIAWGLIGMVAGFLLAIFVSLQVGTAILLAGWTQGDVEVLAGIHMLVGIAGGGLAGALWGGRRGKRVREPARAPKPAPPRWGRR